MEKSYTCVQINNWLFSHWKSKLPTPSKKKSKIKLLFVLKITSFVGTDRMKCIGILCSGFKKLGKKKKKKRTRLKWGGRWEKLRAAWWVKHKWLKCSWKGRLGLPSTWALKIYFSCLSNSSSSYWVSSTDFTDPLSSLSCLASCRSSRLHLVSVQSSCR